MAISVLLKSILGGAGRLKNEDDHDISAVSQLDPATSVISADDSDTNSTCFDFGEDTAADSSRRTVRTDTPGDRAFGSGMRVIVRNVDIGFGYGASEIESYAEKEAREEGDKSLPSIDIPAGKEAGGRDGNPRALEKGIQRLDKSPTRKDRRRNTFGLHHRRREDGAAQERRP